jgi:hypothetical protein
MKSYNIKKISTALVLVVLSLLFGCKHDPKPTTVQKVTKMLTSGTWNPAIITVDGVDVSSDLFAGFSIAFSESTFTTTGTSPVWLRQDTWRFKDENATIIIRNQDNKEIAITNISETQLTFTLEWDQTTYENGRERSLAGKYEFQFNK